MAFLALVTLLAFVLGSEPLWAGSHRSSVFKTLFDCHERLISSGSYTAGSTGRHVCQAILRGQLIGSTELFAEKDEVFSVNFSFAEEGILCPLVGEVLSIGCGRERRQRGIRYVIDDPSKTGGLVKAEFTSDGDLPPLCGWSYSISWSSDAILPCQSPSVLFIEESGEITVIAREVEATSVLWLVNLKPRVDSKVVRGSVGLLCGDQVLQTRPIQVYCPFDASLNPAWAPLHQYLTTLRLSLIGALLKDDAYLPDEDGHIDGTAPYDGYLRGVGRDWPAHALSMIGAARMQNLQMLLETVIREKVPGDFIETGIWRGGSAIFAAALLKAFGESHRQVWACDSFEGLPTPRTAHDSDKWSKMDYLKVSLEQVQEHFRRYGMLSDNVHLIKGYFNNTLPLLREKIGSLSILRSDGDMYESCTDALYNMYDLLSVGGFTIIDDWSIGECRSAVTDFRERHGITEPIRDCGDQLGVYWRKSAHVEVDFAWYFRFGGGME